MTDCQKNIKSLWHELVVQEPNRYGYRYATFAGVRYRVRTASEGLHFGCFSLYQQQRPSGGWCPAESTELRPFGMESSALEDAACAIVSAHSSPAAT